MATGIPLTQEFINASSMDAGNRSMRAAGRAAWNEADALAAQAVINRLLPHFLVDRFGVSLSDARAIVARDFGREPVKAVA